MRAEAILALALAALVVAALPFRRIALIASRSPTRAAPEEREQTQITHQISQAIRACSRRVPWRSQCFEQGLAAIWMLRRRGVAATLHFGVGQEQGAGLRAHVWVRRGRDDVVGCENSGEFAELARFPAD